MWFLFDRLVNDRLQVSRYARLQRTQLRQCLIGHAVNQAARIETMTKMLQQPVLADNCFAKLQPDLWKSVGKHKLDGVLEEVELFSYNRLETARCE